METQTTFPSYSASPATPRLLGTKIPSAVVFIIGTLLFFMPFAELSCNSSDTKTELGDIDLNLGGQMTVTNTGFGLAIGKEWKTEMRGLGGLFSGSTDRMEKQPKQDPNYYAITAMALAVIGLVFCFVKMNGGIWISMLAGFLSAAALVGLRLDLDKKVKDPSQVIQKNENTTDWLGNGLDAIKFELNYTSWYYIAVMAMLAAAVLSYLRMKNSRSA